MQDRGHISKCGDAQTNKDTGVHTHTHTDTHTLHIHLCSTSRMNKPVMQRTNSRTTSLCFVCLSLPLFTKINQVCIWRPFLLPLPVTSGMKEWVREKAGREEEGNSQKRRREYRHSWVVNCNNPSLLSRPTRIRSKRPGGRYDPKTYACTHTHTYTQIAQSLLKQLDKDIICHGCQLTPLAFSTTTPKCTCTPARAWGRLNTRRLKWNVCVCVCVRAIVWKPPSHLQ